MRLWSEELVYSLLHRGVIIPGDGEAVFSIHTRTPRAVDYFFRELVYRLADRYPVILDIG